MTRSNTCMCLGCCVARADAADTEAREKDRAFFAGAMWPADVAGAQDAWNRIKSAEVHATAAPASSAETLRYYALRGCRACGVGADTLHEAGCPEVAKIIAEGLTEQVDFARDDMLDALIYSFVSVPGSRVVSLPIEFTPYLRPDFPDLMAGLFATHLADAETQRQSDQWDKSYANASHASEARENAAAGQDFADRTGAAKAFDSLSQATTAAGRKAMPIATGVVDYFPDALAAVAAVSKIGNDQHNPGEPLHWAREKSTDEADALMRHFVERGGYDNDGVRHSAKAAWRALALLQKEIEADRA